MIFFKRAAIFFALWLVLTGADTGGLILGAVTAAGAAWISLRLLPYGGASIGILALLSLVPGFALRSMQGGIDVAWRALHPRLPVKPGWLVWKTRLPPGGARVGFGLEMSLLPGSLIAGTRNESIYVHCLDIDKDVMRDLAAEEERVGRVARIKAGGRAG